MGAYDEALAKSLSTGDSRDLGDIVQGEHLEKAHVQAHFRRNPKTGALEHIADYDDARHAAETAFSVKAGDKMRVNNPKSKFHGKTVEVLHYSDKYNCVRTKAEGLKHTADFKPELLEHLEAEQEKPAEASKPAEPEKKDVTIDAHKEIESWEHAVKLLKQAEDQGSTVDARAEIAGHIKELQAKIAEKKAALVGSQEKKGSSEASEQAAEKESQSLPTHPIFENPVKMKAKLIAALRKAGIPFGKTYASKQVRGWHSVSQQGVNVSTPEYDRDNPKTIDLGFLQSHTSKTPLKETDMYKKTEEVLKQGGFDYTAHNYGFSISTKNHFLPEQHEAHALTQKESYIQSNYDRAMRKNNYRFDSFTRDLAGQLKEMSEPVRQARVKAREAYEAHQAAQKKSLKKSGPLPIVDLQKN